MGSQRARRNWYSELWDRAGADAARLAFLLNPDSTRAHSTAKRAFRRCIARLQDRRGTDLIDTWFQRDVVRLVARSLRARRVRMWLTRRGSRTPGPAGDTGAAWELWNAFGGLPLNQRAALILEVHEHVPRPRVADALDRSVAGTDALLARAWSALEARLGSTPDAAELERVLAGVAEHLPPPAVRPADIRRMGRRARTMSAAVVTVLLVGTGTGAMATWAAVSTSPGDAGDLTTEEEDAEADEAGSTIGLAFSGTPGWCPDPRRALPIDEETGREATRTAMRVAIAIVKGYTDQLSHLMEVPAGAPPPRRWAGPASAASLNVIARGHGVQNDSVTIHCGVRVAERTWIVVVEDRQPPWDDAVAFYVINRPTGLKVWGSLGALGR